MSWLIDELNEKNQELRQDNFKLHKKVSLLIEEISDLITNNHELETELERKKEALNRISYKLDLNDGIIQDMARDLYKLYPRFWDRFKLLFRGKQ